MSTIRVNAITDASGGNTATINGVNIRSGALDPNNRIVNGAFDFWQRGTSFTTAVYTADRWVLGTSGGTTTVSRQSHTLGTQFGNNNPSVFARLDVSGQSASAHYSVFAQRIESVRSYAGQTITILGWARRASGTGNMAVEAFQYYGTGGTPSATTLISPATVTLTGSWAPFAVTFAVPSITGKTLGTNNNDYLAVQFWASAGADYNSRTNSLGLQTIAIDLWGIHIKVGTHTTAIISEYNQPDLGSEEIRCARYFERISNEVGLDTVTGRIFTVRQSNDAVGQLWFVAPKRGLPTITLQGTVQMQTGLSVLGTVSSATAMNVYGMTRLVGSSFSTGIGHIIGVQAGVGTSAFLVDAEL